MDIGLYGTPGSVRGASEVGVKEYMYNVYYFTVL